MKILIAFDKFKGSLSAADACRIASETVREITSEAEILAIPLTDGGEGFVELLTKAGCGEIRHHRVAGPRGKPVGVSFGLVPIPNLPLKVREILDLPAEGTLAVVEMAQASGLQLLLPDERDPWKTSTRGTGELLMQAAATRPAAIVLGLGGSSTHDIGLGALQALGLQSRWNPLSSTEGKSPPDPVPANWSALHGFSGSIVSDLPPLWIASDVDNPLLGERGAATVFAPQKGLRPEDLESLERETERVAHLLCSHFHQNPQTLADPGSGAAGGIGTGLRIACKARIISGFSLVRAWLNLDQKLKQADLILTGEGTFDESSLEGKGPGVLVKNAKKEKKRCIVLAGRIELTETTRNEYPPDRFRFLEISSRDLPSEKAMAQAEGLLHDSIRKNLRDFHGTEKKE